MQIHHLETLISSLRPSTMRSMTRNHCPRRGSRSTPPLADKGYKLAVWRWNQCLQRQSCLGNHQSHHRTNDFDWNLFELNPRTLKNYGKRMGPLPFSSLTHRRGRGRGPRRDGNGGDARSRHLVVALPSGASFSWSEDLSPWLISEYPVPWGFIKENSFTSI